MSCGLTGEEEGVGKLTRVSWNCGQLSVVYFCAEIINCFASPSVLSFFLTSAGKLESVNHDTCLWPKIINSCLKRKWIRRKESSFFMISWFGNKPNKRFEQQLVTDRFLLGFQKLILAFLENSTQNYHRYLDMIKLKWIFRQLKAGTRNRNRKKN